MVDLQNKKIILFIPMGRGIYGTGISRELEKQGAVVSVYDERPSASAISKIFLRSAKRMISPYLFNYYKNIIRDKKDDNIDYILIIRGEGLTPAIMQMFRDTFKETKLILYLWDSLQNNNVSNVFSYFDKILTFDRHDANNHPKLILRPLFFLPDYESTGEEKKTIDLLFIGTIHSDRFSIIKKIQESGKKLNLKLFFYLFFPSKILFIRKKLTDPLFKNVKLNDFHYKRLNSKEVSAYMLSSRVSFDMQEPNQSGLTMRTIEVVGAKVKLITTNTDIKSYDFYDERNIMIVDRDNPRIDLSFINSPYHEISPEVYEKYSLKGWLSDVLS